MSMIDISCNVDKSIAVWPGSIHFSAEWFKSIDHGDACNESRISLGSHTGTHFDAPLHFCRDGKTIVELPLESFVAKTQVIEIRGRMSLDAEDFMHAGIARDTTHLLVKTDNSHERRIYSYKEFQPDFRALSDSGAQYLADLGLTLVGWDYLSVQPYKKESNVHTILLSREMLILEGLLLHDVEPGFYTLTALPLKITEAEGTPTRAVLQTLDR
jgi:arylformamidase